MVEIEELLSTNEVCDLLAINHNNLHQIQNRGSIRWVKKEGRKVFYNKEQVLAYKAKRDARKKSV